MRVDQAIEDEDPPSPKLEPYLKSSRPLEEGEVLEPDQSVYEMLHRMNVQWPCLSFDVLKVRSRVEPSAPLPPPPPFIPYLSFFTLPGA